MKGSALLLVAAGAAVACTEVVVLGRGADDGSPADAAVAEALPCDALAGAAPTETAVPRPGRFAVVGSRVVGPTGATVVLRGVNVNGPRWVWDRETTQDAALIAETWRFDAVRVNSFLRPGGFATNDDLDAIVAAFTGRGLVVIVDLHDHTGAYFAPTSSPSLGEATAFFRDLALRYRDNPYVWFDLQAKPGGCRLECAFVDAHDALLAAIRKDAAADNLVVVHGAARGTEDGCTGDAPVTADTSPLLRWGAGLVARWGPQANLVMGINVNDRWTDGGAAKLAALFDAFEARGLAALVTGYGLFDQRELEAADDMTAVDAMFEALGSRPIGRLAWHWFSGDPTKLTSSERGGYRGGGWLVDRKDGTEPTNLTPFGARVWRDTHRGAP